MERSSNPVFDTFYRFLIGTLTVADLAAWVYDTDTIGDATDRAWDNALLEFDYYAPDAEPALRRLIRRIYQDILPGRETDRLFWQLDVVATASALLSATADLIDSAGRLCSLCEAMPGNCWDDPDFSVFCIIADQADFIPPVSAREHLSPTAHLRIAREQADFEAHYWSAARQAAEHLTKRFALM